MYRALNVGAYALIPASLPIFTGPYPKVEELSAPVRCKAPVNAESKARKTTDDGFVSRLGSQEFLVCLSVPLPDAYQAHQPRPNA